LEQPKISVKKKKFPLTRKTSFKLHKMVLFN
jgi:hypothetical protein